MQLLERRHVGESMLVKKYVGNNTNVQINFHQNKFKFLLRSSFIHLKAWDSIPQIKIDCTDKKNI